MAEARTEIQIQSCCIQVGLQFCFPISSCSNKVHYLQTDVQHVPRESILMYILNNSVQRTDTSYRYVFESRISSTYSASASVHVTITVL